MTVLEYITKHAGELENCKSREELYQAISKEVSAPIEEYQNSIKDMNFLFQVLKGIFEDGKMDEAKSLYETIKKVVAEKTPQ